jgi:hypothetical protein
MYGITAATSNSARKKLVFFMGRLLVLKALRYFCTHTGMLLNLRRLAA